MDIGKTLYVTERKTWRAWLSTHHKTADEIWLVFYRKDSGKPRISYDDAVLEALCYGWIDSIVKKLDNESFVQRFSPRKSNSVLSQMNKERVRELIAQKKMTKAGLVAIAHVYDPKTDKKEEFIIPPGILKALRADKDAWKNFQKMPESYKRIRVAYVESRKRHGIAIYQKALKNLVTMTAQNKRIGFVKEGK
ncbi:MAG: YdeI/OmpD-associated family protein [Candidatus Aenigmarchaeota archaeon]|nr:YdeI/OmpD-associated family protein [Candidatus Aenigmarchaeota archaeon]